jgi:hypothetical protein
MRPNCSGRQQKRIVKEGRDSTPRECRSTIVTAGLSASFHPDREFWVDIRFSILCEKSPFTSSRRTFFGLQHRAALGILTPISSLTTESKIRGAV